MKIRYNEDAEVVARLREALLKRGLYCPCRLQKIEDNACRSPTRSARATAIADFTIKRNKR